jgi:hypothetical protein
MLEHMAGQNRKSSLRAQIDENLKRVYQDALEQEIPDRLKELLEKLRNSGSDSRESGQ